jgi:tRNA U34 5-carboxymethylaminomethyl modifying GTPase MnmE/TrmE
VEITVNLDYPDEDIEIMTIDKLIEKHIGYKRYDWKTAVYAGTGGLSGRGSNVAIIGSRTSENRR